ncbi:MAG: hypothetical protein KatS3mg113_1130 [Planctomycetaceae bacterium]|nr:MAG: hypothetical protein KatS3mg113_1130 [Planctomycetaceae bacterium]
MSNPPDLRPSPASWPPWLYMAAMLDALRLIAWLVYDPRQPWGDSTLYWELAQETAEGDLWWLTSGHAFRTPGYPWLLSLFMRIGGPWALQMVLIFQHGCVWLTHVLCVGLGWRLTQNSVLTGLLWICCVANTTRPLYAHWILTETVGGLCLIALVVTLCCTQRRLLHGLVVGGLLGASILIRPAYVAWIPMVVTGLLSCQRTAPPVAYKKRWLQLALVTLAAIVCLTPWCVRNQQLTGRFTLGYFSGRQLWKAAFDPWPGGELPLPNEVAHADLLRLSTWRHNWSVARALAERGWKDHELDRWMGAVAWRAICVHPTQFLFRWGVRCLTFWYVKEWPAPGEPEEAPSADWFRTSPCLPPPWHQERICWSPRLSSWWRTWLTWAPEFHFGPMWCFQAVSWCAVAYLCSRPDSRWLGVMSLVLFVSTTVLTAWAEVPVYRYRMHLEPVQYLVLALAGQSFSFRGRIYLWRWKWRRGS